MPYHHGFKGHLLAAAAAILLLLRASPAQAQELACRDPPEDRASPESTSFQTHVGEGSACTAAGYVVDDEVTEPRADAAELQIGPILDRAYLNVPFSAQDTTVWCWVASAQMVARYFNRSTPSQCEMLQAAYGAPCCGSPALCTRPGHIAEIQRLIAGFGLQASRIGPPTNGWALLSIFKQNRPVVLYIDNSHFVVATGMKVVRTPMGPLGIVRINDPFRGVVEVDFPTLRRRWGASLYVN